VIKLDHTILPDLKILENGKAVEMTIKYVCAISEGTENVVLDIYVRQHPNPENVFAYQAFVASCDGVPRRTAFRFEADRYNRPFVPGPAEVSTFRQQCYMVGDEQSGYWTWCSDCMGDTKVVLRR
jgi:hypothetical protein